MRLFLHCGLHKTASTSFQLFCSSNRDILRESCIYYPESLSGNGNHSHYIWGRYGGEEGFCRFLKTSYDDSLAQGCSSVLVSCEDLENVLVDCRLGRLIQVFALSIGYSHIEFIFVHRQKSQYFCSLYSEISKYGLHVSPLEFGLSARKNGFFSLETDCYSFLFSFDLFRHVDNLGRALRGEVRCSVMDFREFVSSPFVGIPLLRYIAGDRIISSLSAHSSLSSSSRHVNKKSFVASRRISLLQITFE